jgi:hypothetical protein
MVNSEELIGNTEYLTLYTRCRINRCRYNGVRQFIRSPYLFYLLTVNVDVVYCHLITFRHTSHSAGLLCTRERPIAEISTWQHKHSQETNIHAPLWDSNPRSQQALGHWDRRLFIQGSIKMDGRLFTCCVVTRGGYWCRNYIDTMVDFVEVSRIRKESVVIHFQVLLRCAPG